MEKRGHLIVTDRFAGALPLRHRLSLKLGCILPDILVHTYLVGHTWESAWQPLTARMQNLADHNRRSCWSYLRLGYVLHYIEDFFTWPHNTGFTGSLADHVRYEHDLTRLLESRQIPCADEQTAAPVALLPASLRWLHSRYEAETACPETDIRYICQAAELVAQSYCALFACAQTLLEPEDPIPQPYAYDWAQ